MRTDFILVTLIFFLISSISIGFLFIFVELKFLEMHVLLSSPPLPDLLPAPASARGGAGWANVKKCFREI